MSVFIGAAGDNSLDACTRELCKLSPSGATLDKKTLQSLTRTYHPDKEHQLTDDQRARLGGQSTTEATQLINSCRHHYAETSVPCQPAPPPPPQPRPFHEPQPTHKRQREPGSTVRIHVSMKRVAEGDDWSQTMWWVRIFDADQNDTLDDVFAFVPKGLYTLFDETRNVPINRDGDAGRATLAEQGFQPITFLQVRNKTP